MRRIAMTIASVAILLGIAAAQESRSEVSVQGTGLFTKDTTGQGTTQRATETGGFLVGYRYHFNRWLAGEGVYGYGRNTQEFFAPAGLSRVQANVHQATGGLVFSLPAPTRFKVHPYVLAEGGALVFDPTGNTFGSVAGAQKQTVGVFAYVRRSRPSNRQSHLVASGVPRTGIQCTRLWDQRTEHQQDHPRGPTIRGNRVPVLKGSTAEGRRSRRPFILNSPERAASVLVTRSGKYHRYSIAAIRRLNQRDNDRH